MFLARGKIRFQITRDEGEQQQNACETPYANPVENPYQ